MKNKVFKHNEASGTSGHNCTVCYAPAGDHLHYGVISCFSCRAFFRRYADRLDKCACTRGDGECVIDEIKRNDCMHCRLKKCLKAGMKKDFVRGPNQSLRRKRLEHGFQGKRPNYKPTFIKATKSKSNMQKLKFQNKRKLHKADEEPMPLLSTNDQHLDNKDKEMGSNSHELLNILDNSQEDGSSYSLSSGSYRQEFRSISSCSDQFSLTPEWNQLPNFDLSLTSPQSNDDVQSHYNFGTLSQDFLDNFSPYPPTFDDNALSLTPWPYFQHEEAHALLPRTTQETVQPTSKYALPLRWGLNVSLTDADNQDEDLCTSEIAKLRSSLESPTMVFTGEEFNFIDFIRKARDSIVGKINNTYYDENYRDELTAILMSKGSIKPSFQFIERLNHSIMDSSRKVMAAVLDLFDLSEKAKKILMSENVCYSCLVGTAVYTHGNDAKTFVEQAKLSGMTTMYTNYLEEEGLAEVVPRMESHYLNPSPWAEQEIYEVEFNDILKQIGRQVGTDQFLICLIIMAHFFSLSEDGSSILSPAETEAIHQTKKHIVLLLNRYLRAKLGPKKASSKTHHHFYLMNMLKKVSKIYMEKKLQLVQADHVSDIRF